MSALSADHLHAGTDPSAVRRWLHANPELGFEETGTARLIATQLALAGYTVHEGVGGTGVVGVLHRGAGPTLALRADMDALPITEATGVEHASHCPGRMHACGHDGHVAILLGAAHRIATARIAGTVVLLFQPAEELGRGARAMLEHPLLASLWPDAVLGLHNWPDLPAGQVAVRPGGMMASSDRFQLRIAGEPSHPALPHQGNDVIAAAAALVPALQETFLRRREPRGMALISVTDMVATGDDHSIPAEAHLRGTIRCLDVEARRQALDWLDGAAKSVAARFGATAEVTTRQGCPVTFNDARLARTVADCAAGILGQDAVSTHFEPAMTGDDFAWFSERWPGAYFWLGTGGPRARPLHDPAYDFDDSVIPAGVALWTAIVERILPP